MKKIIVIGCPGSGKSTLARALHQKTKIPLYHLDMMSWNADRTTVEKCLFLQRLSDVLAQDVWILDGNYLSTMEMRMAACDTVIFLDYPQDICLLGVEQRRGKPRSDMPWIETDEDTEFTKFIKGFGEEQRPKIMQLLGQHKDKNVLIFTNRGQAERFLNSLGENNEGA